MAPFKSSLAKSAGKLFGVFREADLSLRGATQSSRAIIIPFSASGGNIANALAPGNGYKYHTFGTDGNFVVSVAGTVDILVIAGGGGGGGRAGGGGGAGGVVFVENVPLSAGTYPISIGDAGAGGGQPGNPGNQNDSPSIGNAGANSYFGAPGVSIGGQPTHFLAEGGGGGGNANNSSSYGTPGGSSGGSGYGTNNPQTADQPGTNPSPFATDYGNKGNRGVSAPTYNCGGGGGAGGIGGPGQDQNGLGGVGQPFPAFEFPLCFPSPYLPNLTPKSPNNTHFGGGGGGGAHPPQGPQGTGGVGGGGNGGSPSGPFTNGQASGGSQAGTDYLGGGGGGATTNGSPPQNYFGQPGGKGVVIIRYAT